MEEAVRNYFAYRARLNAMELKRLFKQGRTSLIIGLFFLAACFLLREFLFRSDRTKPCCASHARV